MRKTCTLLCCIPAILIAGCDGSDPSADGMVNDASDMAAGIEQASAEISAKLREAASQNGDMPCDLPALPDASGAQPMNVEGKTFTTASTPEQVAAFYTAAAETRSGSAKASGPPGFAEIQLTLGDQGECRIVAQAQMAGDTNVQITKQ